MKLISHDCDNCGAPVDIGLGDRSAACEYCGTTFEVERGARPRESDDGGKLGRALRDHPDEELRECGRLLRRMDIQWKKRRLQFMVEREGKMRVPSVQEARITGGMFTLLGMAALGRGLLVENAWHPAYGWIAGICVPVGFLMTTHLKRKADGYARLRVEFRNERLAILERVHRRKVEIGEAPA